MSSSTPLGASFRDPSGFVFRREGRLFRQVNQEYRGHYDRLMQGGLYDALLTDRLLIPHEEVTDPPHRSEIAYKVLRPDLIPFISYPYEWCFGQLKAAALTTLAIQKRALEHDMSLKDASAFNIQFVGHRPVFIDTLSFESFQEGAPWIGYRQFCQHFLAPLALMAMVDIRLGKLSRVHLDGVPLDLASHLLPFKSRLRLGLLLHLHWHARAQGSGGKPEETPPSGFVKRRSLLGILDSLESTVNGLRYRSGRTEWSDYYETHSYAPEALAHKSRLVDAFIDRVAPQVVWDLGANTGVFSRLAARRGAFTASFDVDAACVEASYQESVQQKDERLLPLILDVTNPSPGLGWSHQERMALMERGPADLVLALGLVHHLAIGANLPLEHIARFLAAIGRTLVLEFIPKDDVQVRRLLRTRRDIFSCYTQVQLEEYFALYFTIKEIVPIEKSGRILYLMVRREPP